MNSSFVDWLSRSELFGEAAAKTDTLCVLSIEAFAINMSAVSDSGSCVLFPIELNLATCAANFHSKFRIDSLELRLVDSRSLKFRKNSLTTERASRWYTDFTIASAP